MSNFLKSEFESSYLGLNIYRSSDNFLPNANQLRNFALEEAADLFRIKIDARYEAAMNSVLDAVGIPYFYSHSVLNVKVDYSNAKIESYKNNGLEFELYTGNNQQQERFFKLIFQGMYNDPIGYYKTPIIKNLIEKNNEASCYAQYYVKYYDGSSKNLIGYMMKKENIDVGCFVFEIQDGNIYSSMAAVLPEYRSEGFFHDMKIFHQNYCIQNNFKVAYTGSRINNFHTPNLLLKTGYQIYKVEHVYHMVSLLGNIHKPNSYLPITCNVKHVYDTLWQYLQQESKLYTDYFAPHHNSIIKFSFPCQFLHGDITITNIVVPLSKKQEIMLVFTFLLPDTKQKSFGYLRIYQNINA